MGDGKGQARVGRRPMIWEQEENAFITRPLRLGQIQRRGRNSYG